jgi:hypothetical protein
MRSILRREMRESGSRYRWKLKYETTFFVGSTIVLTSSFFPSLRLFFYESMLPCFYQRKI